MCPLYPVVLRDCAPPASTLIPRCRIEQLHPARSLCFSCWLITARCSRAWISRQTSKRRSACLRQGLMQPCWNQATPSFLDLAVSLVLSRLKTPMELPNYNAVLLAFTRLALNALQRPQWGNNARRSCQLSAVHSKPAASQPASCRQPASQRVHECTATGTY